MTRRDILALTPTDVLPLILRAAPDEDPVSRRELVQRGVELGGFTAEEVQIPRRYKRTAYKGHIESILNYAVWAADERGFLRSPARGRRVLTAAGRAALSDHAKASERVPAFSQHALGVEYRSVDPAARTGRGEPFSVDPDLIDRALRSHAETQESLAGAVRDGGLVPRSPSAGEPVFDIAWEDGETIVVAEVKSLTLRNEEKQLRLALGQVLRYASVLGLTCRSVRGVIAAEREPSDASWLELCETAGVTLAWPATFAALFEPPTS